MTDFSSSAGYTTLRPEWPRWKLWLLLPIVPWVVMNRGGHRFGWVAAIGAVLVTLVTILIIFMDPYSPGDDEYGRFLLFWLVYLVVLVLIFGMILSILLVPLCPEDISTFRAQNLVFKRLLLLCPYCSLFTVGITYVMSSLMVYFGIAHNVDSDGLVMIVDDDPTTYQLEQICFTLQGLLIELLLVLGGLATLVAGRPGWSSRWPASCEQCQYPLVALPADANCPECGKPIRETLDFQHRPGPECRWSSVWRRSLMAFFFPKTFGSTLITRSPHRPYNMVLLMAVFCVILGAYVQLAFGWEARVDPSDPYVISEPITILNGLTLRHLFHSYITVPWLINLLLSAFQDGLESLLTYAGIIALAAGLACLGARKRGPVPVLLGVLHLAPLFLIVYAVGWFFSLWVDYFTHINPGPPLLRLLARWFNWTPSFYWQDLFEFLPVIIVMGSGLILWFWLLSSLRQIASACKNANW